MVYTDKIFIVTGASSGIGLSISKKLSKLGAIVIMASRNKARLTSLSKSILKSDLFVTDISKFKDIDKLLEYTYNKYGKIDGIISSAGIGYDASVEKTKYKIFEELIRTDYIGPSYLISKAMNYMKSNKSGVIVNISSGTALMHIENMGAYASVKAAMAHFALTAREEYKKYGIQVNVVYPYITNTDFEKNTIKGEIEIDDGYGSGGYTPPEADPVSVVDELIINAINNNIAESYAHDWMRRG